MTDWRPIATAPKDGTEVLLAAPGRVTYGAFSAPSEKPRIVYRDGFAPEPEWDEFEPYWASYDGGFTAENPPTHWMPRPDGPHERLCMEGDCHYYGQRRPATCACSKPANVRGKQP